MRENWRIGGGDWAVLGVLSVLWGGSFLFYRVLAFTLPPFTVVACRVAIGALALLAIAAIRGANWVPPRETWGRFLVLGLLNNALPFTAFAWAETRISGGTASILNATTPIFTVLVAGLVLRTEALTAARLLGIACGFCGVAVLVGPGALLGQDVLGQLACLGAAVSYAFGVPFARTIRGVAPAGMAMGQLLGSTALMLPLALLADRPWMLPAPSAAAWGSLLGLALLSTAAAYLLFFRLLARIGATNLVLVTFLVPISALLLGAGVLSEPISAGALAGMALIAAGLACIDGRLLRRPGRATISG